MTQVLTILGAAMIGWLIASLRATPNVHVPQSMRVWCAAAGAVLAAGLVL
jgi:hypothetical protein